MNTVLPTQGPLDPTGDLLGDPDGDEQADQTTTTPPPLGDEDTQSGPVPIRVPPLGSAAHPPATGSAVPAATTNTAAPPAPGGPAAPTPTTTDTPAAAPDAEATTDADADADEGQATSDAEPETEPDANTQPEIPQEALDALNGLATLGPQIASPLLNAATGIPAAALQGAGGLVPALTSAVLPQLAAMLDQLGTTAPPGSPAARIGTAGADGLAGALGSLAGDGRAADAARATNQTLARQVGALRDVEQQLGDILGLSSARTEADRAKIQGIIDDVETALTSAGVQGNTPEAQAAVLSALRSALDEAGDVVSGAARDKLSDAEFVRGLISNYLSISSELDTLHAGVAGSGTGVSAARAAHQALGLPYVWGGGGALGPTGGGFDCSGLTQYAYAQGSGGRIMLPRTTYEQIKVGRQVPMGALAPGDLVFSNFSAPGVPEHVGIYIGGGQVIHAPQRGQDVQISSVPSGGQARRVM